VLLPGFREDVLQLMKSADLFVMSSVTEGLGSTVLDAMAMRLAVVGTRAGGIPEAVVHGETGLLVPPAEPRELAGAIARLLKDPALRKRMGDAGHARVADQFGVGRLLEGTLQAYRRAARMKPTDAAATSSAQPTGRP
jgi:glycosyltransferase involved in cell wall biosynthesis